MYKEFFTQKLFINKYSKYVSVKYCYETLNKTVVSLKEKLLKFSHHVC